MINICILKLEKEVKNKVFFLNKERVISMKYANAHIIDVWHITNKTLFLNKEISSEIEL